MVGWPVRGYGCSTGSGLKIAWTEVVSGVRYGCRGMGEILAELTSHC